MEEFEYTYEDYLRDQSEAEAHETIYDDEFDYTYEDYLRGQAEEDEPDYIDYDYPQDELPFDDDDEYCTTKISYNATPLGAAELKRFKGTYIIYRTDPKDKNEPYQFYLEVKDGIARIVIEERDWS